MRLSRTKLLLLFGAVVVVVSTLFWALTGAQEETSTPQNASGAHEEHDGHGADAGEEAETLELIREFDPSDPRRLAGFSENIFTATVEAKAGDEPLDRGIPDRDGYPQQQFVVRVSESIKSGGEDPLEEGDRVTLSQIGGVERDSGKAYVVLSVHREKHWRDAPLEVGGSYLFATRYNSSKGWHQIAMQPQGNVPLDTEEGEAMVEVYRRAAEDPVDPASSPQGAKEKR